MSIQGSSKKYGLFENYRFSEAGDITAAHTFTSRGLMMWAVFIIYFIVLVIVPADISAQAVQEENVVTVGSKPHSEQYILAEMISILIEEKTELSVDQRLGIGGGTSNLHPAMLAGEIDIYPEYTGTGWLFVLKRNFSDLPGQAASSKNNHAAAADGDSAESTPDVLFEEVRKAYADQYDIQWLGRYGFNNTYAIAVRDTQVEKYSLETYSDLAGASSNLVFGANYDFYERDDGFNALSSRYGFSFKDTVELDIGLKYQAISSGKVDVINAFSTDGLLSEHDITVLKDDKSFFPTYEAATIIRRETLQKHPKLEEVLNLLTGRISEKEMTRMNYRVEKLNENPREVAREFLQNQGLL